MHLHARSAFVAGLIGITGLTMPATSASAQGGDPPVTPPVPVVAVSSGSTLLGVYTDLQATRGEAVFQKSCLECHVPSDYQGDAFKSKFVGGTAFDMFESIRIAMPQSDPGSLPRQQYADLLAYFFKINALPAGTSEIGIEPDALKSIKVEAKDTLAVRAGRMGRPAKTPRNGIHHGSPHIR